MWVNTRTGEAVFGNSVTDVGGTDEWTYVDEHDEPREPLRKVSDGDEWVPNWLAQQLLHVDADQAALTKQHNVRMAQVKARRKHLEFAYLARAEAAAAVDLEAQAGNKKSVDYPYGRCGWRASKKVTVTDEAAALAWADEHCRKAVKISFSLKKSELPKTKTVPGVERTEENNFYIKPAVPK